MSVEARSLPVISRRQFLHDLPLRAAGGTVVLWGGLNLMFQVAPQREEAIIPYPERGWLLTGHPTRPPLLNGNGNGDFLRHFAFNSRTVNRSVTTAFQEIFEQRPPVTPRLGDLFGRHIAFARSALSIENPHITPSAEDLACVALMSYATVLSNYFDVEDIGKMGVNIPKTSEDQSRVFFMEQYQAHLPVVLPAGAQQCESQMDQLARCRGGDRAMHAVHHMWLGFYYMLSRTLGTQDAERLPNVLRLYLWAKRNLNQEARALSEIAGEVLEWKQTWNSLRGENTKDENGNPIPTGRFESLAETDLEANRIGVEAALVLFNKGRVTQASLDRTAVYLNG